MDGDCRGRVRGSGRGISRARRLDDWHRLRLSLSDRLDRGRRIRLVPHNSRWPHALPARGAGLVLAPHEPLPQARVMEAVAAGQHQRRLHRLAADDALMPLAGLVEELRRRRGREGGQNPEQLAVPDSGVSEAKQGGRGLFSQRSG